MITSATKTKMVIWRSKTTMVSNRTTKSKRKNPVFLTPRCSLKTAKKRPNPCNNRNNSSRTKTCSRKTKMRRMKP